MNHFNTIEKPSVAEYKEKGSRFLAYAFPVSSVDDFKKRIKDIKEEHPKAAHHCFAYRIGMNGINFRSSDDGEPAGTAGKPILGQLDCRNVINAGVVVVRYFGGTLLGVPGLINAYKTVTSFALQLTPVIQKPVLISYELQFDYTLMNDVMIVVKKYKCEVLQNEMQLFCRMIIEVPKENESVCIEQLTHLNGVELKKN